MEKIRVGALYNTHGLKGEVKIKSLSDFSAERFKKGNHLWVFYHGEYIDVIVETCRKNKDHLLVVFEELDNIDKVEKYKGSEIFINRDDIEVLDEGFYYFELLGCEVYDQEDQLLGVVEDVLETGANAVLRINKTILIPFVPAFILDTNIETKKIKVQVIEGMI